jgi:hypothetical protein
LQAFGELLLVQRIDDPAGDIVDDAFFGATVRGGDHWPFTGLVMLFLLSRN